MKKNLVLFMFVLFSIFFINGCTNKTDQNYNHNENQKQVDDTKQAEILNEIQNGKINQIGGQKDEHGCLGPAGYSWDEEIGACTRNWEIKDDLKQPARIAVESLKDNLFTVIEVLKMDCDGCFRVKLQKNNEEDSEKQYSTVEIKNWKVVN